MKGYIRNPLLKAAVFSLLLFFYLATGLIDNKVEPAQTQNTIQHPEAKKPVLASDSQKEPQRFPVRLKIPNINVDAAIQYVGLTSDGAMGVPNNSVDVGWYDQGPSPGEIGSAVIDGHLNSGNGKGVFTDLYKLKQGDKLYIEDNYGTSIAFVVRESRSYTDGYARDVFNRNDSAHLNLITCTGVWEPAQKSYNKRLVVFADITH